MSPSEDAYHNLNDLLNIDLEPDNKVFPKTVSNFKFTFITYNFLIFERFYLLSDQVKTIYPLSQGEIICNAKMNKGCVKLKLLLLRLLFLTARGHITMNAHELLNYIDCFIAIRTWDKKTSLNLVNNLKTYIKIFPNIYK